MIWGRVIGIILTLSPYISHKPRGVGGVPRTSLLLLSAIAKL